MCLRQKNTLQPCLLPLLVLDFVVSMHFFTPPVIFISLLPAFNNSNDSLVYCAWQTYDVPARKSSGLCRLWRSGLSYGCVGVLTIMNIFSAPILGSLACFAESWLWMTFNFIKCVSQIPLQYLFQIES